MKHLFHLPNMTGQALTATRQASLVTSLQENSALAFRNRLTAWIAEFDASLDQQHEVGVRLVSFGQTFVFHLADVGHWNPSLIVFRGTMDDGSPVELIQHVSQISILLVKLPRKEPEKPKARFGFYAPQDPSE